MNSFGNPRSVIRVFLFRGGSLRVSLVQNIHEYLYIYIDRVHILGFNGQNIGGKYYTVDYFKERNEKQKILLLFVYSECV